jgi:hypothetical protein
MPFALIRGAALAGLMPVLAACAASHGSPATPPPAAMPAAGPLDPLVAQAIADLARRLSIPPSRIERIEAVAVTWPDGSLGCPREGMMYPQVLRDGARIRLRANGTEYRYHSGDGRPPFLCGPRGPA